VKRLAEIQSFMAGALVRRRALPGDPEMEALAAEVALGNDRLSPAEQIEIYREQFWLRHTSCLADDFAGLGGVVGQSDWERLVEEYLTQVPPEDISLRDLGKRLPAFVERATWLPHHALSVDMARLEWCYVEVFDAADRAPLDPSVIAAIPEAAWPSVRFELNPALRLLSVGHPVARLRNAIRDGESNVPIPDAESQNLAIFRGKDRNLYHLVLSDAAFAVLEGLAGGAALLPACEHALERFPSAEAEIESGVGGWFRTWADRALIVGVELPEAVSPSGG
jgi:hypothetical protein